jgi:hypothetical protein
VKIGSRRSTRAVPPWAYDTSASSARGLPTAQKGSTSSRDGDPARRSTKVLKRPYWTGLARLRHLRGPPPVFDQAACASPPWRDAQRHNRIMLAGRSDRSSRAPARRSAPQPPGAAPASQQLWLRRARSNEVGPSQRLGHPEAGAPGPWLVVVVVVPVSAGAWPWAAPRRGLAHALDRHAKWRVLRRAVVEVHRDLVALDLSIRTGSRCGGRRWPRTRRLLEGLSPNGRG